MRCGKSLFVLIWLFSFIQTSFSQQPETGLPAFGSFHGSDLDLVSLQNGNLHVELPILSLPQRAGLTFGYKFVYDVPSWQILDWAPTPTTLQWTVSQTPGELADWNVLTDPTTPQTVNHDVVAKSCTYAVQGTTYTNNYNVDTNYVVTDTHGTKHPFEVRYVEQPASGCQDQTGNQTTGMALDGSGITITLGPGGTVTAISMPDDAGPLNGNFFDSLGRAFSSTTQNNPDGTFSIIYSSHDSNGNLVQFPIDYGPVLVQTSFCPLLNVGSTPCSEYGPIQQNVPKKLTLPNGTFYQFTWSTDGNADLVRIDLPTGGYLAYGYQTYTRFVRTVSGTGGKGKGPATKMYQGRRQVVSRTVGDGQTVSTWRYTLTTGGGGTIHDPLGNEQVHVFGAAVNSATGLPAGTTEFETQVRSYQGTAATGTLLRTVNKDYMGEMSIQEPDAIFHDMINVRLIRETTILENGTQSKSETDYEMLQQQFVSPGSTFAVTRLNPIEKRQFDFGTGAPGPLLRRTDYTYLHTNNQNYLSRNIVREVLRQTVYDGNNNQVAQTVNEYDNYNHPNQPMLASGAVQHNATYNTSFIYRGNKTAVSHWLNTNNSLLTTTNQYDDAGSLLSTIDPLGNKTTFDYTDSWEDATCAPANSGQSKAYPTTITNALGQASTKRYNSCTGSLASATDANSQTTNYSYDSMGRTTHASYPDSGQTTYSYNDSALTFTKTTVIDATIAPPGWNISTTTLMDDLGRIKQMQLTTDPAGTDFVDTTYDSLGRVWKQTNPYRSSSSPTDGTTTYLHDALGRECLMVPPDVASAPTACPTSAPPGDVFTSYSGNCTTTTDEIGKKRKSCVDGLGRITQVFEDPSGSNYETDYSYDGDNNLISATQKGSNSASARKRTFTYDSLSHLVCASNPENSTTACTSAALSGYISGTTGYSYDANGNLSRRTAPLHNQTGTSTVTTNYKYDALDRLVSKTYTDGTPSVQYGHDGSALSGCTTAPPSLSPPDPFPLGRRTAMCDGSGATSWSHDQMGRIASETRTILGTVPVTKTTTYEYNADGSLFELTYASGTILNFSYDQAQHQDWVADYVNNIYYVDNATFAPPGQTTSYSGGSNSSFAGITRATTYNSRLQPTAISAKTSARTIYSLGYEYGPAGQDNGNISKITNNLDATRTVSFNYDSLNRIANALTTNWGEAYTIDAWGNMTAINSYQGKPHESFSCGPADLHNRLNTCYGYDSAGNLISSSPETYRYDGENRLVSTAGWTYAYDGDGNRVRKFSSSTGTLFWRDTEGDVLGETDQTGSPLSDYVFFNRQRIARFDPKTLAVHYYFSDHLGTHTVVTNATGICEQDIEFYPYGGERKQYCTTPVVQNYKFTGKERDTESGLDNFGARYFGSSLGRFQTPDPVFMNVMRVMDPQRLNLYAYGRNNPLVYTDPTGKDIVSGTGDQKAIKSALVEIARHPGGRQMLTKLDILTQKITLNTATGIKYPDGTPAPGHHLPEPGSDPHINRVTDSSGKITDVTSPNIKVEIDPALSQQMRDTGDPNAPKSDAELLGHELKETENTDFKTPMGETETNNAVDSMLGSPKDMNAKDAGKFVDDLLKPNTNNQQQQQQQQPPPPKCTDNKQNCSN